MGISRYNSEGYADPTAHRAVCNIEGKGRILHIGYPTGYMDIRLDQFFPCAADRARKLFRLLRDYGTAGNKQMTLDFLRQMEQEHKQQISILTAKAEKSPRKNMLASLHKAERGLIRARGYLKAFYEITGYGREG